MQSYTECEGPACANPGILRTDADAYLCDTHASAWGSGDPPRQSGTQRFTTSEPWGRKHSWLFRIIVTPIGAVIWAYICLRDRKLYPFA